MVGCSTDSMSQNGLQNAPESSSRSSQDALGATLLLEAVFGAMLGSFWGLRNLENHAPAAAGARFSEIKPLAWGAQNRAQNEPKIEPQTTPRGLQIARKVIPNRCSIFKQISAPILTILGPQNGTKNRLKKQPRRHKAAQMPPGGPKRPPGGPQEAPRRPQEAPRRPPGGPQEAPRRPQKVPRQTPRTTSLLAH